MPATVMATAVLSNPDPIIYPSSITSTPCCGIAADVYDIIKDIKDPEHPYTLEELKVVEEDKVNVKLDDCLLITVEFTPTVPHCSLATLIGLCIRIKLERCLPDNFKLQLHISKGSHSTEEDITKQINDKERIIAAMENPSLKCVVEECIKETSY